MSISALSSSSSQLDFPSRVRRTGDGNGAEATRGAPPPRPPEGGGFASAIADALKAIGITAASDSTSTSISTATSGTSSASSTDATGSSGTVADALGSFLQSLMGALHAQNTSGVEAPAYGEGQQGGGPGGPGKLESDLQSLLSKLTTGGADSSSGTSAGSTDDSDAVSQLESSFANLLDKLSGGAGSSTDSTDANTKLAAFLQALSTKVGDSGASGNLVNTTV